MSADIRQIAPVLPVADVRAAAAWYERALGFQVGFVNEDGGQCNYALLDRGGLPLHLSRIDPNDPTLRAPANCYLYVDAIEPLHQHLMEIGANVGELQTMPWGQRECWLHDPDGNRLVLSAEV